MTNRGLCFGSFDKIEVIDYTSLKITALLARLREKSLVTIG